MTADDDAPRPPVPSLQCPALNVALFALQLAAYALDWFGQRPIPDKCTCTTGDEDRRQCLACMKANVIVAAGHEGYAVSNAANWLTCWLAPLPQALIDLEDALAAAVRWPDAGELAEIVRLTVATLGCKADNARPDRDDIGQTDILPVPARFEMPPENLTARVLTLFTPSSN